MPLPRHLWKLTSLALLGFPIQALGAQSIVQKITVSSVGEFQLQVQTSGAVAPRAQIVTEPERLVIDIPDAVPAAGLRNQNLNRSEVTRVRVGLFSTTPPVTRIVLDLNSPQWYRIEPAAAGFIVKIGASEQDPQSPLPAPTIGWVSGSAASRNSSNQVDPFVVRKAPSASVPANGARVRFSNGLLEIHARNSTLSEVLFQIQKETGAEIAIPAGTEAEHVIADFGPAPAREVLAQLLNGTDLNFVAVGSENDPKVLRSVLLSRKTVGYAETQPADTPPPAVNNPPSAVNIPPGDTPDLESQPDQNPQPPQEQSPPPAEAPPGS